MAPAVLQCLQDFVIISLLIAACDIILLHNILMSPDFADNGEI